MMNSFNNLDILGKTMVIVLIVAFIILIGLVIYLIIKNNKVKDIEIDTDFLDEIKSKNDIKSVEKEGIKASDIATKIEPKEEKKEDKFDISVAAKQMQEDINNNLELTEFEMEQEEKSIISYEELLRKVKQQNSEDSNIKVNVQTVELDKKEDTQEFSYNTEILDFSDIEDTPKEDKSTLLNKDDLKEMLSISEVDTSLYSSDDFLNALKELRDSLD